MDIETFKKFCGTDYPEWIKAPWNQKGHTYATDGHVVIRVLELTDIVKQNIEKVEELPWSTLGKRSIFRLLPSTFNAVRERFTCENCSPDAPLAPPCTKCEGKDSGEDCLKCGGVGLEKLKSQKQWNTSQCPECESTRWTYGTVWCLRNHENVNKRYYLNPKILQKMIDNLGPIEFVEPPIKAGPVGFRFEGGEGLLMPMTSAPWHVAVNLMEEKHDNGDM